MNEKIREKILNVVNGLYFPLGSKIILELLDIFEDIYHHFDIPKKKERKHITNNYGKKPRSRNRGVI